MAGDDSDSDGFLSEVLNYAWNFSWLLFVSYQIFFPLIPWSDDQDSSCMYVPESENGNLLEGEDPIWLDFMLFVPIITHPHLFFSFCF